MRPPAAAKLLGQTDPENKDISFGESLKFCFRIGQIQSISQR